MSPWRFPKAEPLVGFGATPRQKGGEGVICRICPRNCGANRDENTGTGFCKTGTLPHIARIAPHQWEEPCISGTNGSGTIFFSGCVMRCVFCQNEKISRESYGKRFLSENLTDAVKALEQQGVHNINLVSPTPYVDMLIECFSKYKPSVPIVWNTGGYEKAETIRRLEGIVDIYLPDLKYVSDILAVKYSKSPHYFKYASEAIKEMVRQTGDPVFDENGIMKRGTIVRHLVLPNCLINTYQVLKWLNDTFGSPDKDHILVSLMAQYFPAGHAADYAELNRPLNSQEYEHVCRYLEQKTDLNGFIQELSAATAVYVPDFNMK